MLVQKQFLGMVFLSKRLLDKYNYHNSSRVYRGKSVKIFIEEKKQSINKNSENNKEHAKRTTKAKKITWVKNVLMYDIGLSIVSSESRISLWIF